LEFALFNLVSSKCLPGSVIGLI